MGAEYRLNKTGGCRWSFWQSFDSKLCLTVRFFVSIQFIKCSQSLPIHDVRSLVFTLHLHFVAPRNDKSSLMAILVKKMVLWNIERTFSGWFDIYVWLVGARQPLCLFIRRVHFRFGIFHWCGGLPSYCYCYNATNAEQKHQMKKKKRKEHNILIG